MENYEDLIPEESSENIPSSVEEDAPVETQAPTAEEMNIEEPIAEIPRQKPAKPSPFASSPYEMPEPAQTVAASAAPRTKKSAGKAVRAALACVLVLALIATGCLFTARSINGYWTVQNEKNQLALNQLNKQIEALQEQIKNNSYTGNGNSVSGTDNANPSGLTPGQLYAKCVNSVVAITANVTKNGATGISSGSGFVISEDGYIVTNAHVVADAIKLTITVHDGHEYAAVLIGADENNDLALLRTIAPNLQPATLGSSDALIVGDQVVAIGNPLGVLTSTLTVGYISAKERNITTDGTVINMLQTDAAINPGNSGGPLFNMNGEVIGINTAKYSGATSSGASIEGIGFAIPMDDVLDEIEQLRTKGYVSTPYMGINIDNRTAGIGAYVVSVDKGSAAEKAGMLPGDVIIQLGDAPISNLEDVNMAMRNYRVGDTATVTVYRNRKVLDLTLTFGEKPQTITQTPTETTPSNDTDTPSIEDYIDWWNRFFGNG